MASYSILLVCFGLLGIAGMVLTTMTMFQAGGEVGPSRLMPGTQVAVWQMESMRAAKVVGLTEVPLAWHDESLILDGSTSCALMDDRLIRVESSVGTTINYADMDVVEIQDDGNLGHIVTTRGKDPAGVDAEIICSFRSSEGGPKMARMLQSEQRRTHPAPSHPVPPSQDPSAPHGQDGGDAELDPDQGGDAPLGDGADQPADGSGEGGL
jgi:hypothetical protein